MAYYYSLFMLSRYLEELRDGKTNLEAVSTALSKAGRVIFVSGLTLGLTNAGLTFCTGACGYNRPCAHQYVGKSQSCMV